MPPRKRTRAEMEASEPPHEKKEPSLLQKIRDMWEFSAVMQYIYLFGKVVKIDEDFDVEDFEEECLKPGYSEKLEEIGLTLLKWISSHRGLTYDIWDEYVRRQYLAKAPDRNPYGEDEEPKRFRSFDVFQKIRILHQLTVWTFWNPDRIREKIPEHQKEIEQTEWRMEPFGWDSQEREYYILDDNRMYRRAEPSLPPVPKAKPKSNTIKARAARRRASKRQRLDQEELDSDVPEDDDASQLDTTVIEEQRHQETDTYGGYKWECVAISLGDFNEFLESIKKTRDPNEKELRQRIIEDVLPVIEAAAEKQRRKQERRERELMLMEKMAGAKRSSRLADKQEREKRETEEAENARKRAADLAAAHREQEIQQKMEEERRSRMMTREQRIKDREHKRILKEEELARDEEEQRQIEEGAKRGSERQIKERLEKNKKELEELDADEEWTFDCSGCGKHGKNFDDGAHSVACERCNVWQHSKCLGISKTAAEKDDFHFVCGDCRRKEEEAKRPKIMLKFGAGQSSPPQQPMSPVKQQQPGLFVGVDIPLGPAPTNGLLAHTSPNPRAAVPQQVSPDQQDALSLPQFGPPLHQPHHQTGNPNAFSTSTDSVNESSQTAGPASPRQHQQAPKDHALQLQQSVQTLAASTPVQSTPRPLPGHEMPNRPSSTRRLPSPVVNRPTISPTQGNHDVGPIAGVPGSSPVLFHPALLTPHANGTVPRSQDQDQQVNGNHLHQSPTSPRQFISQSPNPQHLSGLSPVKQRVNSPLPSLSNAPEKSITSSMSSQASAINSNSFNLNANTSFWSISGTPIFPPAEKLAPSPEQMNREPLPTPSKQPSPVMIGGELRRVSGTDFTVNGTHVNGNGHQQPPPPPPQFRPLMSAEEGRNGSTSGQQS